jgi:hypothetical protein
MKQIGTCCKKLGERRGSVLKTFSFKLLGNMLWLHSKHQPVNAVREVIAVYSEIRRKHLMQYVGKINGF